MKGREMQRAVVVVVSIAALAAIAGCGGDDSTDSGSSSVGDSGGSKPTLKVALPTAGADSLNYVADSEGFFADEGVDVEIIGNTGANLATMVASGQADIGVFGAGSPLLTAAQGKPSSIIYALTGGGQGGSIVGPPETKTLADLQAKSGDCRIGSFPPGSSAYGYANLYKQTADLDCDIVPLPDVASQIGALSAGRVDALVGAYPNFASTIDEGKATLLMDSRDPAQRQKYIGRDFVEVVLYGDKANLQSKGDALVPYLKALKKAADYIGDQDPAEVAAEIKDQPALAETTQDQVESDVASLSVYQYLGSDDGFITEPQWDFALTRIALWGLPGFDPQAPSSSYAEAIDMSYYEKAFGVPATAGAAG